MARERLNVTMAEGDDVWTGYVMRDGYAFVLCRGDFETCRKYAKSNGFDGVSVCSPYVAWAGESYCIDFSRDAMPCGV